jgi:hypothetical protein
MEGSQSFLRGPNEAPPYVRDLRSDTPLQLLVYLHTFINSKSKLLNTNRISCEAGFGRMSMSSTTAGSTSVQGKTQVRFNLTNPDSAEGASHYNLGPKPINVIIISELCVAVSYGYN